MLLDQYGKEVFFLPVLILSAPLQQHTTNYMPMYQQFLSPSSQSLMHSGKIYIKYIKIIPKEIISDFYEITK